MAHYTPHFSRETRQPSRREERLTVRPPVTRGHRQSEPLREEAWERQSEPLFLWIFSFSVINPDGVSFRHWTGYAVKPNAEAANDAGWRVCLRDFPEEDGYTMHNIVMEQVALKHVVRVAESLSF